jgi:hypothetical protein
METLPQEILDEIFRAFNIFEHKVTARFHNFPAAVRQAILNCRLVQRRWRDSLILERLFVNVLEETPFVWHNHRIPKLEDIGDTKYGNWMQTLSLCGMDLGLISQGADARWGVGRKEAEKENSIVEYLVHLLLRVSWVEHLRYYTISPKCLDGTWPEGKVSEWDDHSFEKYGYPALAAGEHSWYGVQNENEWTYQRILEAFYMAGLWIESIEMPLLGNRAAYCALEACFWVWLPETLRRLSMTVTKTFFFNRLERFLKNLSGLEILEMSFSTDREWQRAFLPPGDTWHLMELSPALSLHTLPKLLSLKEFRLMSDNQFSFSVSDICEFLTLCPKISELGFAHIMFSEGTWKELMRRLEPLRLESIHLLSPRDIVTFPVTVNQWGTMVNTRVPVWPAVKYEPDQHTKNAAKEVKLIHTESPTEPDGQPKKSRTFEYPGFAIFE